MTSYVTSYYANAIVSRKYCAVLKTKNYVFITQTIRLPKNFLTQKINKFMKYAHTKIRFGRQVVCSHILIQKTENITKITEFRNPL